MDARYHAHGKKNDRTACGLSTHGRVIVSDTAEVTCARCKPRPQRLTDRQRFLLGKAAHSPLRVSPGGRWEIIRAPHQFHRIGDRQPSNAEGMKLVEAGFLELSDDPNGYTEDSQTGVRTYYKRASITPKGQESL